MAMHDEIIEGVYVQISNLENDILELKSQQTDNPSEKLNEINNLFHQIYEKKRSIDTTLSVDLYQKVFRLNEELYSSFNDVQEQLNAKELDVYVQGKLNNLDKVLPSIESFKKSRIRCNYGIMDADTRYDLFAKSYKEILESIKINED